MSKDSNASLLANAAARSFAFWRRVLADQISPIRRLMRLRAAALSAAASATSLQSEASGRDRRMSTGTRSTGVKRVWVGLVGSENVLPFRVWVSVGTPSFLHTDPVSAARSLRITFVVRSLI